MGKREKWYLPEDIFCDALNSGQILVNTPALGVITYKVHINKNGDYWIKGDQIAKYILKWFNWDDVPRRAYLTKEQKDKYIFVNSK